MVRKFTTKDLRELYNNHFYKRVERTDRPVLVDAMFENFFDWLEEVDDELR